MEGIIKMDDSTILLLGFGTCLGFILLIFGLYGFFSVIEHTIKSLLRCIFKDYYKAKELSKNYEYDELDMLNDLEHFSELKNQGIITEEEFKKEKKRILKQ